MKIPKARQLPSGAWFCRVRIDGQDIAITRDTEKEAVAEAMAVKSGIKEAEKRVRKKTLTAAIDDYIEARQNILSPSTIRGYRIIQNNRFQSMMKKDVFTVTQDQWQRAVNLESKRLNAKTLTNSWRFLSSVIAEATGKQLKIRLPQIVANERSWLSPEQVPVFVEAIKGTSIEIPALLYLSSLRRSEMIALKWDKVDLKKKVIYVQGARVRGSDGLVEKKPNKNKTSRRVIPIIPPLMEALEDADRTGEYVCTMTGDLTLTRVNQICAANNLPEVGLHGLHHSFASLAYHLGMPEMIAAEIGGWKDLGTMHKIYTHLAQKDIAKRSQDFCNYFDPEKRKSQIGNKIGNAK